MRSARIKGAGLMVHKLAVRRRHRLNEDETPLVYVLVSNRLRELLEDRRGAEEAEPLLRLLIRMDVNQVGRPSHPPFTWGELEAFLGSTQAWAEPDYGPMEVA